MVAARLSWTVPDLVDSGSRAAAESRRREPSWRHADTSPRNIRIKPLVSCAIRAGTIRDVAKSIGVHEITLGKWVNKAKDSGSSQDKELSEAERAELERLRKENAVLRMERDFAKKVAAWFAKEQP